MELLSWTSLIWLATMVIIYWLLPSAAFRGAWLAISNAGLLLYYYPQEGGYMLGLALLTFMLGRWLGSGGQGKRWALALALGLVVFYLVYTKYTAFLLQIWSQALTVLGQPAAFRWEKVAVPLGISFVTFRWLHYLIDSYRGVRGRENFLLFLAYSFFWPILTAGPIERWQDFSGQVQKQTGWQWEHLWAGMSRILLGLFKKVLIAAMLAPLAAKLQNPEAGAVVYWLAAHAYAWQLYVDFSGYTDIAIGAGLLFGLRLQENFDWPYFRGNISLFWKHWHMSLTRWFRDYLFIPLGGSRVPLARTLLNTLIVMLVTGLWHGAGWNFLFWGGMHAAALILWRLYRRYLLPRLPARWPASLVYRGAAVLVTYNFVVVAWVPFATGFRQAKLVLAAMFGGW